MSECDTWLCLGGGPSAPAMLKLAQRDYPDATTITCNSGIRLIDPDYYFLQDKAAIRAFCVETIQKQKRGTKTLALASTVERLAIRGITVDYVLEGPAQRDPAKYRDECDTINLNGNLFSGIVCAMFAMRHGAKTLILVGHDGYSCENGEHTNWDYTLAVEAVKEWTDWYIGPWWRGAVAGRPDVTFHWYGPTHYEISGPNVRRTRCDG